jgi:hypothetical protein
MKSLISITVLATAIALAVLTTAPAPAAAQERDRCEEEQDTESKKDKNYKTVRGADGRKVFVIERAFVVCGKVPKPQVIYVLHQRNINYEWENLKQDFLPKVLRSVKQSPF